MHHTMRFGFGAIPSASVADSVALAQAGEQLGFDMLWVPDQTFHHDPFVLLAACAGATSRIQLMLGVANPFTRHPVQVARAAATLDELSGGRMAVGYGAGNRDELVSRFGMEHAQVAARCREAVLVTQQLLRGETIHVRSDTLVADGIGLEMPPRPHVPVYLAGRSPKVLDAAGALADGVIIGSIAAPNGIAYALEAVAASAAAAGRTLEKVDVVSWVGVHLLGDDGEPLDYLRPRVAQIIGTYRPPFGVLHALGLGQERIDVLQRAYASSGKRGAARLVADDEIGLFALIGTAEQMRERVVALARAGVTQLGLLLQQETVAEQEAFLRRFAADVIGPLRASAR